MKQIPRDKTYQEERESFKEYIKIEKRLIELKSLCEEMKHSAGMIRCYVTPGWAKNAYKALMVACVVPLALSLGLAGKATYDLVKPRLSKQECRESIGNTLDIRVYQEGKGKETIKFLDHKPFGSLDEVVKIQDGKVITLSPNDVGFQERERVYQEKIIPYLNE